MRATSLSLRIVGGTAFGFRHAASYTIRSLSTACRGSIPAGKRKSEVVVGLTGGIASGKSTVGQFLQQEFHIPVVDADVLGHNCYVQGTAAYQEIVRTFGPSILTSPRQEGEAAAIDRRKLGRIVFSDPSKLRSLCDITWPCIRTMIAAEVRRLRAHQPLEYVGSPMRGNNLRPSVAIAGVVEAAILVEAGWEDEFDEVWSNRTCCFESSICTHCPCLNGVVFWANPIRKVWAIAVPEAVACKRLMERNGVSENEVRTIFKEIKH